jgi:hypothetical protein
LEHLNALGYDKVRGHCDEWGVAAWRRDDWDRCLHCLGNQLVSVTIIYELRASISSIRAFTSFLTSAAGGGLSAGKRIVPFPEVS